MMLRDSWASEASAWLNQYGQLKRAFERESEATKAAEARAEALGRSGDGDGGAPPAKLMRVRSAQVYKEKYPGTLTVQPGDTCIFIDACTLPLWSRVKMENDGRVGIISASKLEEIAEVAPEPEPTLAPSDDEEPEDEASTAAMEEDDEEPADEASTAAMEEEIDAQFVEATRADEAAHEEADAAECGYA
eukprot:7390795-Prymnesium_polylepis.2